MQLLHVPRQILAQCDEERPAALVAGCLLVVYLGLESFDRRPYRFDFVQQASTLVVGHRALEPGCGI